MVCFSLSSILILTPIIHFLGSLNIGMRIRDLTVQKYVKIGLLEVVVSVPLPVTHCQSVPVSD